MKPENTRKFIVQGRSELIGMDGLKHTKVMVRIRGRHGRKQETWIDVPDGAGTFAIGDTVTIEKVKPYRLAQEEGECTS